MGNDVSLSEKPIMRDDRGRWLPGSGSPSPGRPPSSRQKIATQLLTDLSEVWEKHGSAVLTRLAVEDPGKLATIAYGILPKEAFVRIEDQRAPGNLDAEAWASLRRVLDLIEQCGAGGKVPRDVLSAIEEDLRARLALPIELK